jgi:membrane-associated phospholipid phosphatase
MTALRRMGLRLATWLRVLVRPSRIPPERRTPLWPVKGWITVAALAAILIVVAGSMWLFDALLIGEARLLPKRVIATFEWITWFGNSGWFLWPTGILLLIIAASPWSKLPRMSQGVLAAIVVRTGFIFLAIGLPALFVTIAKRFFGRARPYVWEVTDPYSYSPFIWKASYASFPSGHATNAFAAAIAIGALWPRARLPMWIFALVIAISRVVVNAHFPSDIIVGAVVGVVGALLVRGWFAARHLGFTVGSDATIHRLPGPSWRRTKAVARKLLAP